MANTISPVPGILVDDDAYIKWRKRLLAFQFGKEFWTVSFINNKEIIIDNVMTNKDRAQNLLPIKKSDRYLYTINPDKKPPKDFAYYEAVPELTSPGANWDLQAVVQAILKRGFVFVDPVCIKDTDREESYVTLSIKPGELKRLKKGGVRCR